MIDAQEVDVTESTDRWCEYRLEDGSVIRAKPVIASFVRLDGVFDHDGNPLYGMRGSMNHLIVSVPDNLKKKSD
jgi:hypothetical protein